MVIGKTYQLPFPPEKVYAAWISSGTVIAPATRMDIEPVVGGHYRLFMETPDFTARNEGTFLEIIPGKRIIYTWEWNGDGEITKIAVTFTASSGGAQVDIHHSGFSKEESRAAHDQGWDNYIDGLTAHLKTGVA